MYVSELASKLTSHRQAQFMEAPLWRAAAAEGLSWREAVRDRRMIQHAIMSLTGACGQVLRAIYLVSGGLPIHEERMFSLGRARAGLSGAEFRLGLMELQQAGIVLSVRQAWGERLCFVPRDMYVLWHQQLFPHELEPLNHNSPLLLQMDMLDASAKPLGRQLLVALSELAKCGLGRTVKDIFPKKTVNKVTAVLELSANHLRILEPSNVYKEYYPLPFALLLEISVRLKLIEQNGRRMYWNENELRRWLQLPSPIMEARLLECCVSQWMSAEPFIGHCWAFLSSLQAGRWYSEQSVLTVLTELGLCSKEEQEPLAWAEWLHMLSGCGWLERASSPDGKLLRWRMKPITAEMEEQTETVSDLLVTGKAQPLIIEPNGEMIVMPNSSFCTRWELELIAERRTDDHMTIYQITPSSAQRAMQYGRTAASMAAFLQQAGGRVELPLSVSASLEDWSKRYARHAAEAAAPQVKGEEAYYPQLPIMDSEYEHVPNRLQGPAAGILLDEAQLHRYELIEDDRLAMTDIFPELDRVPASWMKQLRAYHFSTRREMLEKAVSWQTPVQLGMNEGLRAFIPSKLETDGEGWAVIGLLRDDSQLSEVRLTPEMWQEMRLLLPDKSGNV